MGKRICKLPLAHDLHLLSLYLCAILLPLSHTHTHSLDLSVSYLDTLQRLVVSPALSRNNSWTSLKIRFCHSCFNFYFSFSFCCYCSCSCFYLLLLLLLLQLIGSSSWLCPTPSGCGPLFALSMVVNSERIVGLVPVPVKHYCCLFWLIVIVLSLLAACCSLHSVVAFCCSCSSSCCCHANFVVRLHACPSCLICCLLLFPIPATTTSATTSQLTCGKKPSKYLSDCNAMIQLPQLHQSL